MILHLCPLEFIYWLLAGTVAVGWATHIARQQRCLGKSQQFTGPHVHACAPAVLMILAMEKFSLGLVNDCIICPAKGHQLDHVMALKGVK